MAFLGARRFRCVFAAATALAGLSPCAATAGEPIALEDTVKAAYVYKFAPFVTWPTHLPAGAPFTICSIGSDRVSALLPQVVEGQRIDDRPIQVRVLTENEAPGDCAILYIAAPVAAGPVLDAVHGKPILTVTASDGPHGVIQLVTVAHHVSFDIDAKLAAEDGLTVSSKLLGLARTVTRPAGPPS
jgi:YfiR/HmsC-like